VSPKSFPRTHFGFCTDGHPGQLLGIATFLKVSWPQMLKESEEPQIYIAVPTAKLDYAKDCLGQLVPHKNLNFIDANEKEEDRYFVQISLAKIFDVVDSSDIIICCDYDHVIMKSISPLLSSIPNSIFVSSEVRKKSIIKESESGFYSFNTRMQLLNTSLIWGKVKLLRKIGRLWEECYYKLETIARSRYLVEYAFGLAAVRADINVNSCSSYIQGNITNLDSNCILFHYGGDTDISRFMKNELYKRGSIYRTGKQFKRSVPSATFFLNKTVEKIFRGSNLY